MATVKCTLVREKLQVIIRSEAFSQCTSFRISNPYLSPDFCTCVKTNHRPLLPKGFIGSSENISHTEHNTFPGSQIHPGPPLSGNGSLIYSATPVGSLGCVLRLFPHTKSRQVSLLSNPWIHSLLSVCTSAALVHATHISWLKCSCVSDLVPFSTFHSKHAWLSYLHSSVWNTSRAPICPRHKAAHQRASWGSLSSSSSLPL